MAFKDPASFLRYLTMGAVASRSVMTELRSLGFDPVELERGSSSNKIWSTKIKRLRLPDVLCVRTGLRVEVKAKSTLEVRMSHSPNKPDRVWDAGLGGDDIVAFVHCSMHQGSWRAAPSSLFQVSDLRASVDPRQLSRIKSSSEGSEQHLTWPTTVPKRSGTVLEVSGERIVLACEADGERSSRNQVYRLGDKYAYVKLGERVEAGAQFLAGTPRRLATLTSHLTGNFDPVACLRSNSSERQYEAAKAITNRPDLHKAAIRPLEVALGKQADPRVALEVAGAAAALGIGAGKQELLRFIFSSGSDEADAALRMEAVFILTELASLQPSFAREQLERIAGEFAGEEVRQAAVWGLGRAGLRAYDSLITFLEDAEPAVVLHAIAALSADVSEKLVDRLVNSLADAGPGAAPTYAAALRSIGTRYVVDRLAVVLTQNQMLSSHSRAWLLAALGSLPERLLLQRLSGQALLQDIEPVMLASSPSNWLAYDDNRAALHALRQQVIK